MSGGDGLSPSASTTSRRAAIEQRALTELGALSPPPELAAEWKAVLAYTRSTFAYDAKIAQYARTGDDKGVLRQIEASEEVQLRLLSAAVRAGMRRCDSIG